MANTTVAALDVRLRIDDSGYTETAKKAEKSVSDLSDKNKALNREMQGVAQTSQAAKKGIQGTGEAAAKASGQISTLAGKYASLQSTLGNAQNLLMGGVIGGAAIAGIGAIAGATGSKAATQQSMAIASGGNKSMYAAMDQLYRDINGHTTTRREDVGKIVSQSMRRFPELSGHDRAAIAQKIAQVGEQGEDVSLIVQSLDKLSKASGAYYGLGGQSVGSALDLGNTAAVRTGSALSTTLASMAAVASGGAGLNIDQIAKLLIAGEEYLGESPQESAGRILAGSAAAKSQKVPAWDYLKANDYRRAWLDTGQLQTIPIGAGMDMAPAAANIRNASLSGKGFDEFLADLGTWFWSAIYDLGSPASPSRLNRASDVVSGEGNIVINQNITFPTSPTEEATNAARINQYLSGRYIH